MRGCGPPDTRIPNTSLPGANSKVATGRRVPTTTTGSCSWGPQDSHAEALRLRRGGQGAVVESAGRAPGAVSTVTGFRAPPGVPIRHPESPSAIRHRPFRRSRWSRIGSGHRRSPTRAGGEGHARAVGELDDDAGPKPRRPVIVREMPVPLGGGEHAVPAPAELRRAHRLRSGPEQRVMSKVLYRTVRSKLV